MNVLFVYSLDNINTSERPLTTPEQMQFGISYISAALKEQSHDTRLVILSKEFGSKNKKFLNQLLSKFQPKLICFTAVTSEYHFIANIASYLKGAYQNIYQIIGGVHASLNPDRVLEDAFDAVCVGEGEYPICELAAQLQRNVSPSGVMNIWFKRGNKIEKNGIRPFLQNLDNLPFPDRQLWQEWTAQLQGSAYPLLLGRGCPFECAYCSNHAIKKISDGKYVRFRSIYNILEELRQISRQSPQQKKIYLEVESFGLDKEWALKLCAGLAHFNSALKEPFAFRTNLRITPHARLEFLFQACQEANIKEINIGLESGSERVRRTVLRRTYSNQDIIDNVAAARKYGLKIAFYNMIGIPGETLADFRETVKLNRLCLPDRHYTSIFFPYPGTDLYEACKKHGLLPKRQDNNMERRRATLELPGFNRMQIQKSFILFDYYVFKGYKPFHKIAGRIFVSVIMSNSFLYRWYSKIRRLRFLFLRKLKGDNREAD